MNKKDLKLIGIVAIIAILLYGGLMLYQNAQASREMGVVKWHEEEILTFDLNKDDTYTFEGDYGTVNLEVKGGSFRVFDVDCPNHNCEQQGWVSKDSIIPVVCLPNQIIVTTIQK